MGIAVAKGRVMATDEAHPPVGVQLAVVDADPWPEGCPPEDALDANGIVYYIVRENPCVAGDFQTVHERKENRGDPCNRCGLSVYTDLGDVRHNARKYPKLGSLIARATLSPEHGKIKQTGKRSHHTWWATDGVARHSLFQVISGA